MLLDEIQIMKENIENIVGFGKYNIKIQHNCIAIVIEYGITLKKIQQLDEYFNKSGWIRAMNDKIIIEYEFGE